VEFAHILVIRHGGEQFEYIRIARQHRQERGPVERWHKWFYTPAPVFRQASRLVDQGDYIPNPRLHCRPAYRQVAVILRIYSDQGFTLEIGEPGDFFFLPIFSENMHRFAMMQEHLRDLRGCVLLAIYKNLMRNPGFLLRQ
jgi:hypothetical protein